MFKYINFLNSYVLGNVPVSLKLWRPAAKTYTLISSGYFPFNIFQNDNCNRTPSYLNVIKGFLLFLYENGHFFVNGSFKQHWQILRLFYRLLEEPYVLTMVWIYFCDSSRKYKPLWWSLETEISSQLCPDILLLKRNPKNQSCPRNITLINISRILLLVNKRITSKSGLLLLYVV